MSLAKWAVDSAAKEYWSSYFKEYGKTWVRDIPRKVRKAMAENTKTANSEGPAGIVSPIASALTKEAVFLEGLFSPPEGAPLAFCAEFDHKGNLTSFDTVDLVIKTGSKPAFLKSKGGSKSKSTSSSKSKSKSKSKKPSFLQSK